MKEGGKEGRKEINQMRERKREVYLVITDKAEDQWEMKEKTVRFFILLVY